MANILSNEKRVAVIGMLTEGTSQRAVTRVTGVAKQTVADLLVDIGTACASYQDRVLRNLDCKRLELDEQWSFVYCKAKNVPAPFANTFGFGDAWTWKAIDCETKLVPTWFIGPRDEEAAQSFVSDLASRLTRRVQITTDGLRSYLTPIESTFGADVDYAMLVKEYASNPESNQAAHRYSPGHCTGAVKTPITGSPDGDLISTSYIERQNLTTRMHVRRFTRLTNGFSKKVENHAHAVALHLMHYNFVRIHQTLRITPAMAAGVASHPWELEEVVGLLNSEREATNGTLAIDRLCKAAG